MMADVEEVQGQKDVMMERGGSMEEPDHGKAVAVQIPRVSARTITGPANLQNQGAIDWGQHGLLAYGSNYTIVIIDTKNIQTIQCLDKHKSMVNKVLWDKVYSGRSHAEVAAIDLISSDTTGHIIVWNIATGVPRAVLQEGNKPVMDMQWVPGFDGGEHNLAALHPPYSLVIWDTLNKTKLWKKTYTETLVSFKFDPFDASKMAFLCNECILFVDDFTLAKVPSSNGRKFYVSSPRANTHVNSASSARGSVSNLSSVGLEEKQRSRDRLRLRRLMKDLVVGETKPKPDDFMTVSECLQLEYHQSMRHHLLLLYAREVLILDLHINQTVGIVPLDKASSPLVQIKSMRQRDVLYCLHESGSVSAKVRRRQLGFVGSPLDAPAGSISSFDMGSFTTDVFMEMGYEQRCQSEGIRYSKGSKVLGMAVSPICEKRIALFLNLGKVVFVDFRLANSEAMPAILPDIAGISCCQHVSHRQDTLNEMIGPLMSDTSPPLPPLRLLVTGLLTSAASLLTVVRMCPPLTTRNWQQYAPLMAGGTASGLIQVFNMATGAVDKELAVHSYAVRGIEWTNLTSFLSFAYPNVSTSSGLVRNEFLLTDSLTGSIIPLRTDKGDEPPIDMVRVSPLKQYFVVILKEGPFELWDLRNLCMLRTMPKKFPSVAALEWSPIHNLKSLKKKLASVEEKEQAEPTNMAAAAAAAPTGDLKGEPAEKQLVAREHFVFSDSDSQLYHFSVEGNIVRDGIKIPPENGVGTVTSIAFKNDQIVQGDVDGMLNIWDLKARTSKNVHTGRGWIKKMRFAPGKGNLKLLILYSDGVDVVDLKKNYERISQLKCPKDMVKVLDIDWAASDKPVLATQDGCLRIMDMTLTTSVSPLIDYEFQEPVFCPTLLLPPVAASRLQLLLSTQWWREEYSLSFSTADGFSEQELQVVQEQLGMLDPEQLEYLQCCPLGTAERSLIAARLFGNQAEIDFWTVALYYLQTAKLEMKHSKPEEMPIPGTVLGVGPEGSPSALETKRINRYPHLQPLDSCFDILCEPYTFQRMQLERVSLHESKRGDYEHTKKVIEQLILLGETDRAVQLLLETEFDNPSYYTDAIKACLVATIQSTGAAQSTTKLVATNLIANGNVWEGVQLLCLIGKGLDACRYLISYGLWEAAVWLAKSVLPTHDMQEVMRKWSDHLWTSGHKGKAILVTLSMGHFERTLELLGTQRSHALAGLLLQAGKEFGLFTSASPSELLVNAVQLDFARLLFDLGCHQAALKVSQQLGTAGEKLCKEFTILTSEKS